MESHNSERDGKEIRQKDIRLLRRKGFKQLIIPFDETPLITLPPSLNDACWRYLEPVNEPLHRCP